MGARALLTTARLGTSFGARGVGRGPSARLRHRLHASAGRVFLSTVGQDQARVSTSHSPPLSRPPPRRLEQTDTPSQNGVGQQRDNKHVLEAAVAATSPRQTWTREEISAIYYQPLMELVFQAVRKENPHLLSARESQEVPREQQVQVLILKSP